MLPYGSCCVKERDRVCVLVSFKTQKVIEQILINFISIFAPDCRLEQFVKVHSIKELFELTIKYLHLVLEVARK